MLATCLILLIFLNLIALLISGQSYKLWKYHYAVFFHIIVFFSLLVPNIPLNVLFSKTLYVLFLRLWDRFHTDTMQQVKLELYIFLIFASSFKRGINAKYSGLVNTTWVISTAIGLIFHLICVIIVASWNGVLVFQLNLRMPHWNSRTCR